MRDERASEFFYEIRGLAEEQITIQHLREYYRLFGGQEWNDEKREKWVPADVRKKMGRAINQIWKSIAEAYSDGKWPIETTLGLMRPQGTYLRENGSSYKSAF